MTTPRKELELADEQTMQKSRYSRNSRPRPSSRSKSKAPTTILDGNRHAARMLMPTGRADWPDSACEPRS